MTCTRIGRFQRFTVGILVVAGVLVSSSRSGRADLVQAERRALDGTAYLVVQYVQEVGNDAEKFRLTTLAASQAGGAACNASSNAAGSDISAVAGSLIPTQLPYAIANLSRTALLTPNDGSFVFDSAGSGTVTLGSGGGALKICLNAGDCTGGQALAALNTGSGGVPKACLANGVNAGCDGANTRFVYGFGPAATADVCDNVSDVTVNSKICGPMPTDGFDIPDGGAIVFVASLLGASSFTTGVAGFGIDTNNSNAPGCDGSGDSGDPAPDPGDQVVGAEGNVDTKLAPIGAPATPTPTPTQATPPPPPTPVAPALSPMPMVALALLLGTLGYALASRLHTQRRPKHD